MRIECEPYELVSLIEEATNKNMYAIKDEIDDIKSSIEQLIEKIKEGDNDKGRGAEKS